MTWILFWRLLGNSIWSLIRNSSWRLFENLSWNSIWELVVDMKISWESPSYNWRHKCQTGLPSILLSLKTIASTLTYWEAAAWSAGHHSMPIEWWSYPRNILLTFLAIFYSYCIPNISLLVLSIVLRLYLIINSSLYYISSMLGILQHILSQSLHSTQ